MSTEPRVWRVTLSLVLGLMIFASSALAGETDLLDPVSHPKFVNDLPIPAVIDARGPTMPSPGGIAIRERREFRMQMRETEQWLGLEDGDGNHLMTTVWGYGLQGTQATYPGPTFLAMRDVPVVVEWANKLPMYNYPEGPGPHLLPVDPNIHLAHPVQGGIPTVTHLHGGHSESASDGLPEAWYTQNYRETGPHFVKQVLRYDNDQEAATLWYHDHALGITRLNVYAGLAGFYLLRDDNENALINAGVLPSGAYELGIVIQDRMFTEDGALFYPSEDPEVEHGFEPLPEGPSVIAEFFGDFILVNGMSWPKLNVEPRKYRLRFLNGSDSRFYVLEFRDSETGGTARPFMQIGTDNGLLEKPVVLNRLLIGPGERADLVVDFSNASELTLRNFGPDDPFKGFNNDGTPSDGNGGALPPADPATTGKIMKFMVDLPLNGAIPNASVAPKTKLRNPIKALMQDGATRQLVLFEGLDQYGRLQPLLGTLAEGSLSWFQPITENPMLNDVEVWEVYNATEDAHPIHLHLVSFQILDRRDFKGRVEEIPQPQHDGSYGVGGKLHLQSVVGRVNQPAPNERGWKDTAIMLPGQVTRVIARFDREGRYVWHCHILSHEDHEMMRPYHVGPMPADATEAMLAEPIGDRARLDLRQNEPNPFTSATRIGFEIPAQEHVAILIYDVQGRRVRMLADRVYGPGSHSVAWDGRDQAGRRVSSGVYFYELSAGDNVQKKKMLKVR